MNLKKRLWQIGKVLAAASVALVVVVLGGGYWYLRQSLAQEKGALRLEGLEAPVDVIRDASGVPHIFAENERDVLFALGYVHAQDRLWQMHLQRRVGEGRLSELFGPGLVGADRYLRTLGLFRAARESWEACAPETRAEVEAYTAGVNAFIRSHSGRHLPPEFTILRTVPEPWEGRHVFQLVKMMALSLTNDYGMELLRADLVAAVGAARAQELLGGYAEDGPGLIAEARSTAGAERVEWSSAGQLPVPGLAALRGGFGSNAWVIDGAKSTTGKPVLGNDPHLSTDLPAVWYLAHLHAGRFDVIGATVPGLPGVIVGRNRRIAWGITALRMDVQDLFRERLNADGSAAEYRGRMEPVRVVQETVKVKGAADVVVPVRITRHGPLLSDALNANGASPAMDPLALRWTALDPESTIESFLKIDRALGWEDFRAALRSHVAPALSFVYADVDGNIGYQAAGRAPVRASGTGILPAEGWTGAGDWASWVAFDDLPHVYNPPEHFIVSANDRPGSGAHARYLGRDWDAPYRARRIRQLLEAKEKLGPDEHEAIQADLVSVAAQELLPKLLRLAKPETDLERRAVQSLRGWSGEIRGESGAAAIYEVWVGKLRPALVGDELGPKLIWRYWEPRFLAHALEDAQSPWCDDVTTDAREDCPAVVSRALREAIGELAVRLGPEPNSWRWDRLHRAVFAHATFHPAPILRPLFSRSVATGGDSETVNLGAYISEPPFEQRSGATYRQIVDLSSASGGRFLVAIGESGHFLSPHYDDYLEDWRAVRGRPLRLERHEIEKDAHRTLRLQP